MIFDINSARYVLRVTQAVMSGTIAPDELTNVCPECDQKITRWENDGHAAVDTNFGPEPVRIIIACEGYWMVDPTRVGLDRGDWMSPDECAGIVTPDGVDPNA
jgi:hypothetical protein